MHLFTRRRLLARVTVICAQWSAITKPVSSEPESRTRVPVRALFGRIAQRVFNHRTECAWDKWKPCLDHIQRCS
jgi:hypothetical protein